MGPGYLFDNQGQLQPDRPEQLGRQLAHSVNVALGKSLAPPPSPQARTSDQIGAMFPELVSAGPAS